MSREFLDLAARELGFALNGIEQSLVLEAAIRSFDEFHSVLTSNPSLARARPGLRWDDLLKALEQRLSPEYQAFLRADTRSEAGTGATFVRNVTAAEGPPADWPALGEDESLVDAKDVDLLGLNRQGWEVRNQGKHNTCVAFAAAATLERVRRKARTTPVRLLAPVFLFNRIVHRGGLFLNGGTCLEKARETLATDGICREPDWRDTTDPAVPPPPQVIAAAKPEPQTRCWNLHGVMPRWPGPARAVYRLLERGRPVAITIKVFKDPAAAEDNWHADFAKYTGKVQEPLTPNQAALGHAVCILAFQKDANAPLGGWFIFRNSWGENWAVNAPVGSTKPEVPGPGYGAISAKQVNDHVVEIFAPDV